MAKAKVSKKETDEKLKFYMNLPYRMIVEEDTEEGGYGVWFPDLPGCITCGETIAEAAEMAKDAKLAWFEACLEEERELPMPSNNNDYSGQFRLRIPKTLHKKLAEEAKKEGISMNQYCIYLLTKNSFETVSETRKNTANMI